MDGLQHESFIPLYHQLKEKIKDSIDSGMWKVGDKIPSENQLMEQFSISRNTARKAIEELVQEGILYRTQGKGTFIAKPKFEQSLTGFYSFSKVLREKGMNPKDILLGIDVVAPKQKVKEALQLAKTEKVVEIKRLRCANDEPFILESSYIPKSLVTDLEYLKDIGKVSLYDLFEEKFNIRVSKAKEAFEPVLIRDYESAYFKIKEGLPALLLERIAYDQSGKPVEFCKSIIPGDRCRFYTELT